MAAKPVLTVFGGDALREGREAAERGQFVDARVAFARGFENASRRGDADAMAHAALGLGGIWVNEQRAPDEYLQYRTQLSDALLALGEPDSLLSARLKVRLAAEASYAEHGELHAARAAVDCVRRFDDAGATCEALSLMHHLLLAPHDRPERERVVAELVEVATHAGPMERLMGLVWTTVDALLAGNPESPRLLARLRVRAAEHDHAALLYLVNVIELMFQLRSGEIGRVEAALDSAHARGVEVGEVDATPWMAGQLLSVRWLQGRQHEVLDAARAVADSPEITRFNRVYPAVWAAFAAAAGNHDEARVALARVDPLGDPPTGLAPSSMWLVSMFAVVEAVRHLNDTEMAQSIYERLVPFAELPMMASLAVVCFGSTHRSLAWCAAVAGDEERAIGHFRCALSHNVRIGNLPMLAITRAELASMLPAAERREAQVLLDRAIASGTEFGMTRWVEQWQAEQSSFTSKRREPIGQWCRQGAIWVVEVDSARLLVTDSLGMRIIAKLVASPHRDIPVGALTGAPHNPTRQVVLDARARDELRRRIRELQHLIEQADATGDGVRSEQLCDELNRIEAELGRHVRPGGLSRDFVTPTERARTSVQKAIRRALDRIAEQAPDLAEKLRRSIHTGTYCRFQPVAGLPQLWQTNRAAADLDAATR